MLYIKNWQKLEKCYEIKIITWIITKWIRYGKNKINNYSLIWKL